MIKESFKQIIGWDVWGLLGDETLFVLLKTRTRFKNHQYVVQLCYVDSIPVSCHKFQLCEINNAAMLLEG